MLSVLGNSAALIAAAIIGVWVWTFVASARRGRWGWCAFIFLMPALAIILFWLINPRPMDRGPRPA